MKHYGIDLAEGSDISNLTVDSGTSFPGNPNEGELFFRSDTDTLYVYTTSWTVVGSVTAGSGLTSSGNTLNVGTASSSRIVVNADNIDLATVTNSGVGSSFVKITRDGYGRITGTQDVTSDDIGSLANIAEVFPTSTNNPTSRVGSLDYIGIDLKSDYKGSVVTYYKTPYVLTESDGSVVGIRPGFNGVYDKMFFFTSDDMQFTNCILTDVEYKPSFLTSNEYVSSTQNGNQQGFIATIKNYSDSSIKYYWVYTNGTLNPIYHTYIDVTTPYSTYTLVDYKPISEFNLWVGVNINGTTNIVTFYVFDNTHTLVNSYEQIDFDDINDVSSYGTRDGFSFSSINIDRLLVPSIYYYVNGTNIELSCLIKPQVIYSGILDVGFNSVAIYNTTTNSFSDYYTKPYSIDPSTNTYNYPFFLKSGIKVLGYNSFSSTQGYNFEQIYNKGTSFNIRSYTTIGTQRDLLLRFYDPNYTNLSFGTPRDLIPSDASWLGKNVKYTYFGSSNRFITQSDSTKTGSLATNTVYADVTTLSNRRTIVTTNDSLEQPSTIEQVINTVINNGINNTHTTLSNTEVMRVKKLDGLIYKEYDVSSFTETNSNVITLPSDYSTQIQSIVDSDSVAYGTSNEWHLYHVSGSTFLLSYGYADTTTGFKCYHKLLSLSGATFGSLTSASLVWSDSTRPVANNENANTCGIFNLNSTTTYMIYSSVGGYKADRRYKIVVTKINPSTWTFVSTSYPYEYYWVDLSVVGVHPSFGPYFTEVEAYDSNTRAHLSYIDNTSESNFTTRLTNSFESMLLGNTPSELIALTVESAVGYNLYLSETPVYLKGKYYVMTAQNVNIETLFSPNHQNKTFYVFVELINSQPTLTLSETQDPETYSKVCIGTVETDGVGINSSNISSVSRIDTYKATTNVEQNSLVIRDINGRAKIAEPVATNDIATKNYVDSFNDIDKVNIAGDTMTGPLVLTGNASTITFKDSVNQETLKIGGSGNVSVEPDIIATGQMLVSAESDMYFHIDNDNNGSGSFIVSKGSVHRGGSYVNLFRVENDGTLHSDINATTYTSLLTDDADIPNKKYVDNQIISHNHDANYVNVSGDDMVGPLTISVNSSSNALRINQIGTGDALVVEDSANPDNTPFVVKSNGATIVGYTSPLATKLSGGTSVTPNLQVQGVESNTTIVNITSWNTVSTTSSGLSFSKSVSGSIGTHGDALTTGALLGQLSFSGTDGTSFNPGTAIHSYVDGPVGTNSIPGRLTFLTTPIGSTVPSERMRINNAGDVGIGTNPDGYNGKLIVAGTSSGNSIRNNFVSSGTIQSDVTSAFNSFNSYPGTQATTFTLSTLRHFIAQQGTVGAGSTITNQYGFFSGDLTGATNNYGVYSNLSSATGKWNIYANGTANNYFRGNVSLGGELTGGITKQNVWIRPADMITRTTNGAGQSTTETTTNKIMVHTFDFDAAVNEYVQFSIRMRKGWNEGTISAFFTWSVTSGTGNVVWGIQAVALSDNDIIDAAFGTAVTVTDGVTAVGDVMQTAETSACTIAGSPAEGDWVVFQIYRDAVNASDTLTTDARLHGVTLIYSTASLNDA